MNYDVQTTPPTIAVIGLGYVGLPLATALSSHFDTVGHDTSNERINALQQHIDVTGELSQDTLKNLAERLAFSHDINAIARANFFIITVPTPVDHNNLPDLSPLLTACSNIGKLLKKNDIVVFESTVFPGATEGPCAQALENASTLQANQDFFIAYSPERINPGDKKHTLQTIVKVVAASKPEVAEYVKQVYEKIIPAGVYLADSIKTAEAAKAIENTQRDVNIAFMNELAMMFHEMDIDTLEVLKAANTKWNFLPFTPGLVGGHCIGVDPYYLIHKSEESGFYPQLIKTARKLNEKMSTYVCERILKILALNKIHVVGAKILILGLTFKENCPDLRNTRVLDIVAELQRFNAEVEVYDPWVDKQSAAELTAVNLIESINQGYDIIVAAVAHDQFISMPIACLRQALNENGLIFDLKGIFPKDLVDARL